MSAMEQQPLFNEAPKKPPAEVPAIQGKTQLVELMAQAIAAVHVAQKEVTDDVDLDEA